tara:strand:- start:436 stop:1446 length:1011 start_codon:yes stop_codon:yes gene_type:complete
MSHFVVIVAGEDVDAALAPFQENNMGDCPAEYLKFHDETDDVVDGYENGTRSMVRMPDGREIPRYSDEVYKPVDDTLFARRELVLPEGATEIEKPNKEIYGSLEEFAHEYHGFDPRQIDGYDEPRFGYFENPNAKWDWYLVGGRWTGYFKTKPGVQSGKIGRPGLMTEPAEEGRADSLRKGDIDFEAMMTKAGEKAAAEFDRAAAITDLSQLPCWDEIRDRHNETGGDIDTARDEHNKHPAIIALKELDQDLIWVAGSLRKHFCAGDRDAFIERARKKAITPFALLVDGEWMEQGEMGWFGCVSNEQGADEWHDKAWAVLDALDDDTILTAIDCHV